MSVFMDVIGLESCFQPLGSNLSESGQLAGLVQGRMRLVIADGAEKG